MKPITISASVDGKVRLDYGSPATLSRITTPDGRIEVVDGRIFHKSGHAGAFAQLDWLSVLGIRHLATGMERRSLGISGVMGRLTERTLAVTGRQQTHYERSVRDEAEVQFDTETQLVAAISRKQYATEDLDHPFVMTTVFSDYRQVSGVVLPYRISRYLNGRLRETITVASIEINPFLSSDLFER